MAGDVVVRDGCDLWFGDAGPGSRVSAACRFAGPSGSPEEERAAVADEPGAAAPAEVAGPVTGTVAERDTGSLPDGGEAGAAARGGSARSRAAVNAGFAGPVTGAVTGGDVGASLVGDGAGLEGRDGPGEAGSAASAGVVEPDTAAAAGGRDPGAVAGRTEAGGALAAAAARVASGSSRQLVSWRARGWMSAGTGPIYRYRHVRSAESQATSIRHASMCGPSPIIPRPPGYMR